jgi:hypothetical protein
LILPKITNLGYSNLWTDMSTILGYASNFTQQIQKLFSNGEQGFAYDPNDLTTLYQDAAGTVPVTTAVQPVGLVLDKSKGLTLSPELFNNETVLLTAGTTYLGDSTYRIVSSSALQSLEVRGIPLGMCLLDYTVLSSASGSVRIDAQNYAYRHLVVGLGNKKHLLRNSRGNIAFVRDAVPTDVTIRINSIRQILGNHTYQTTSSMRPQLVAAPQRLDYDTADDKLITNLPTQLTGCTVVRSVPNIGTQILTNQTIPTPYNNNIDNCGLIVINRALTASETNQITKLFNKSAGV